MEGLPAPVVASPLILTASFSGIIGVGKSTLIKRLRKTGALQVALPANVHVTFVREPSRMWQERGWLAKFYEDPSHNALAFQLQVFTTYVAAVKKAIQETVLPAGCDTHLLIVERSMYDQRLFWEQQRDGGMATADKNHNSAYKLVWNQWRSFIPEVAIIFLFTTTHLDYTMRRVQARARAEELGASLSSAEDQPLSASVAGLTLSEQQPPIERVGGLTLEYQERLQRKHLDWFTQPTAHPLGAPREGVRCVHVCADDPFHVDDGSLQRLAEMLALHIVQKMKGQ